MDGKRLNILAMFGLSSIAILSIAIAGIVFVGQAQQHSGIIEPVLINEKGDHCFYDGRLKSDSRLFRGNDLFSVVSPTIKTKPVNLISSTWLANDSKGRVRMISDGQLATHSPVESSFSLKVKWHKVTPIMCLAVLLSLTLLLKLPSLVTNEETQKSNAFRNTGLWKSNEMAIRLRSNREKIIAMATYGSLSFALITYLLCIVWPVGWILGDAHFILSTIVQGQFTPGGYFPSVGRFFPLGFLDLNMLISFGDCPQLYQIERALLFIVLISLLFHHAWRRCGCWIAALLLLFFLSSSELLRIFADVIFPETLLCVALATFFWSYYQVAQPSQKFCWQAGLLAIVAALVATYCKEPVFGALVVFGLVQLIFGSKHRSTLVKSIDIFLLVNGAIYLASYLYNCGLGASYIEIQMGEKTISRLKPLIEFLRNPAIMLMFSLACYRIYRLVIRSDRERIFEDGSLLAGIAYVIAFCSIGLSNAYYIVPAYVCWFIALSGYFSDYSRRLASLKFIGISSQQNASVSLGHRGTVAGVGLSCLMIIACLQSSNVIKGIDFVINGRKDTSIMNQVFAELVESGFEIFVYVPSDMSQKDIGVQNWRRTVINTFQSALGAPPALFDARGQAPVKLLDSTAAIHGEKFIIIHDSRYGLADLNVDSKEAINLMPVQNMPLVVGAEVWAPVNYAQKINSIVEKYE